MSEILHLSLSPINRLKNIIEPVMVGEKNEKYWQLYVSFSTDFHFAAQSLFGRINIYIETLWNR